MVKSAQEIASMRVSGGLLASVFDMLDRSQLLGMSSLNINDMVERFIVDTLAARPASKGQYGFEFVLNSSKNHVICHGVPNADDVLEDGDIINLDITLEKNGFIADSSKTYIIGNASVAAKRIVRIAENAMWQGIAQVRPGAHLGDIGYAIEKYAKKHGCSVVKDYCGHGIGRKMHEAPSVPNFGRPGKGAKLEKGMVFTIEPMINQGRGQSKTQSDGWTVVTRDGKLSAQFEHTVAVIDNGVDVLTLRENETEIFKKHVAAQQAQPTNR